MQLHWHRSDLRLADNLGLAATDGPTAGLFVLDPEVLAHAGPPRVAFLLDGLGALCGQYRERASDLLLARGDPADIVPGVAEQLDATTVSWGRAYSGLGRERAAAVETALAETAATPHTVHDAVLHEPGTITTNDGDPYQVFTYFSKKWHDRETNDPADTPTVSALVDSSALDAVQTATGEGQGASDGLLTDVPTITDLDVTTPEATVPPAGTAVARDLLAAFCDSDIYRYADDQDYPARECTSRLSAHLTFGTIGIREVFARTVEASLEAPDESARESVREFQDQLAWREFYAQVLWDRPDLVRTNFKEYAAPIQWREDPEGLAAWKAGETGYPLVDAGMRQLHQDAWMHNRVRMVVASFLTKDLLVDWREGYDWFREKLVDHDTANDTGGWQWAASTGTDAQPYFRIFNPMTQGERYDPDAEYITTYVPELDGVEPEIIHSWDDLDDAVRNEYAPDYPAPLVDHAERREAAIELFERARNGG